MLLVEKSDLENWASRYEAKGRFPYLVKSLICEAVDPSRLRFPSGTGIWLPGYDGEVENSQENRFVPFGSSVWELGTEPNPQKKAQEDYDKRSANRLAGGSKGNSSSELALPETTFVFVTPHVWTDKDVWAAEREKDGNWKRVKVVDAVDLVDWLEASPATYVDFAPYLGRTPDRGWQSPDQAWDEWRYLTEWPISEELVLAGRGEQRRDVLGRLIGPPSTFVIRADSAREAWGFALAAVRVHVPEEERFSLQARAIVVDDERVALQLASRQSLKNHIVVLKRAVDQVSGILSSKGCHVIVPLGNDAIQMENHIVLPRSSHHEFAAALAGMALPEGGSVRISRECGGSITILQRLHPHANARRPKWADDENATLLLPAVLAGRWNERSEADRKTLCQLAGVADYTTVESQLKNFLRVDEPPLQKVGEMWTLTSHVDAFQLTAWRLTKTHLEGFRDAFRDVFGRIDPKVEIPLDDWISQDIRGEQGHSGWLRTGLAETLLLIAERGANAQLSCQPSPSAYAEAVVRGLPGLGDDWRVLASVRDQYPMLIEAAPAPFVDSLEHLLEASPSEVRRLFAEGRLGFASPMHTGLLWGLEILAWDPEYLPRIALVLSKLATIDPGGRWMNRPINTLADIFLWWHPGTNATNDQRLAAVDLILGRFPDVGWNLLVRLLPGVQTATTGTTRPHWRDVGELPEESRSRRGQGEYASALVDRALHYVDGDLDRWRAILHAFRALNASQQDRAIALLNGVAESSIAMDVRMGFWEMLRDFISQRRMYGEASGAPGEGLVDRLEAILPKFAPADAIERSRWLFDDWVPGLPDGENDVQLRQKRVEELRQQAVREILSSQGLSGLTTLGTACKYPGMLAAAALPTLADLDAVRAFLREAISAGEAGLALAGHISGQARAKYGDAWRDLIYKLTKDEAWSANVVASLLMWWPDEQGTWRDAEALGGKAEYWSRKPVFDVRGSADDQVFQIDRLIEVGRAAQVLAFAPYWGKTTPTGALVRLFDAALNELYQLQTVEQVERIGLNSRHIREFLNELRGRPDLPRDELARREYFALPVLGPLDAEGLTLHEFMAENPSFFVDVVCDVYRRAHPDKEEDTEPTPEVRHRAERAYTLLYAMKRIPGTREGNEIDEGALLEWINAVRTKAAGADRAEVTDIHIGQILAHAPEDPEDHAWPHRAVRASIETLRAEKVERGLMIERFNMRGTYSKALFEGGDQERGLANQYREWAKISRARWPTMAQVLDMIARDWEEDARREDTRAEQDKLVH